MDVLLLACLCLLPLSVTTTDGGPEVIKVEQDSDVVLPCSLSNQQDITAAFFHWKKVAHKDQRQKEVFFYNAGRHYNNGEAGQNEQFRGRVSHFEDQLKHGNASIIIRTTKMADSGTYTCDFPHLQPPQTFYIELVVDPVLKDRSAENIPGAAPKPSVTSLDETKDWRLLQCEAHGNPQPAVEWQDSDGNKLSAEQTFSDRGGSSYVTLNVTVTKTGRYRCVATQKTINHQIHAETFVRMNGAASKPHVKILHPTEGGTLLQCEVFGASPDLRVEWEDSVGNKLPANKPTVSERAGSYDVTLNITVTKTDYYRCVTTDQTNKHTRAETYVSVGDQTSTKLIIGVVGVLCGIVVGVAVAVAVAVVRSRKRCNNGSYTNPAG